MNTRNKRCFLNTYNLSKDVFFVISTIYPQKEMLVSKWKSIYMVGYKMILVKQNLCTRELLVEVTPDEHD